MNIELESIFVYFERLPKEVIDPERLFATASKYSLNIKLINLLQNLPEKSQEELQKDQSETKAPN